MQVTANEFVMVICLLVGIIAGLCGYIFKINVSLREAQRALSDMQKDNSVLKTQVASLQVIADKQKTPSSDEFTKPLNYKKTYLA